jgi:hypothetical protein
MERGTFSYATSAGLGETQVDSGTIDTAAVIARRIAANKQDRYDDSKSVHTTSSILLAVS